MMNFSPVFMILSLKAGQLSASIGGNSVIHSIMSKFVFFLLFLDPSASGFHSGAPSALVSGNKGKRGKRHHQQQVLAGSDCEWNGSFGLL